MTVNWLEFLPVVLIFGASIGLLTSQHWRFSIIALALQYLAMFWLITQVWPVSLAAVKLITGWMAGAVLSASQPSGGLSEENLGSIYGKAFRVLAALIVWVLVLSIQATVARVLPVNSNFLIGGLGLMGMGLLQLGVSTRPLRVILGLLTTLSGFEILYAAVEGSLLVAGLLAVITLGLALAGAYMLSLAQPEESE